MQVRCYLPEGSLVCLPAIQGSFHVGKALPTEAFPLCMALGEAAQEFSFTAWFAEAFPGHTAAEVRNRNRSSVFLQRIDFLLPALAFCSSFQQQAVE